MEGTDKLYYEVLKMKIADAMLSTHPTLSKNIRDWRGNEIFKFQEDLKARTNAYISEKTFYNHFKTLHDKLPRIDLLNILSRYAGYIDWADFKTRNPINTISYGQYKGSDRTFYWIPVAAVLFFAIILLIIRLGSTKTFTFRVTDADTHVPVANSELEVLFEDNKQSPLRIRSDSAGFFQLQTDEQKVKIIVHVPFYLEDTVTYIMNDHRSVKSINLKANYYAMMLDYLANSKLHEWKSRREKLERIISDSAYICQVNHNRTMGLELYNKAEFIDLLTTPTGSLKHMNIMEVLYTKDRIITIRFCIDKP